MMPRSRFSVALYLFLVFGSGVLVGIASNRLYSVTTASAKTNRSNFPEFRKQYLDGMRDYVKATPDQLAEVSKILEDTKKKVDELTAQEKPMANRIQQQHIDQIKELLNPDQRDAYDNWRAARERAKQLAQKQQQNSSH